MYTNYKTMYLCTRIVTKSSAHDDVEDLRRTTKFILATGLDYVTANKEE